MAGGVGEGAIPLSVGYSEILGQNQGQVLAELLPLVFFGNLTAILISGFLNDLGKRYPHLTGNGRLQPGNGDENKETGQTARHFRPLKCYYHRCRHRRSRWDHCDYGLPTGVLIHSLTGLPAPVGMLFIAVLLKLISVVPSTLEEGTRVVFRFFVTAVTYPLLFATAVALTPWRELVAAFHPANLITIVATVSSLTATGYFVATLARECIRSRPLS